MQQSEQVYDKVQRWVQI